MKKLRLSKKQQQVRRREKQEEEAAERAAQKLKTKWESVPSFSSRLPMSGTVKTKSKTVLPSAINERIAAARATPSLRTNECQTGPAVPPRYEGEFAERERLARERKHVVAPAYNKGGLQLITDPEHLKTMGRKI